MLVNNSVKEKQQRRRKAARLTGASSRKGVGWFNKRLLTTAAIVLLVMAGMLYALPAPFWQGQRAGESNATGLPFSLPPLVHDTLSWHHEGGKEQITIELATTPESRKRGLGHRRSLPDRHGMLFLFPKNQFATFWMKDTYIALDMIFISEEGTVVALKEDNQPLDLREVRSPVPVFAVLEVAAGKAREWNIGVTTILNHKVFHQLGRNTPRGRESVTDTANPD